MFFWLSDEQGRCLSQAIQNVANNQADTSSVLDTALQTIRSQQDAQGVVSRVQHVSVWQESLRLSWLCKRAAVLAWQ